VPQVDLLCLANSYKHDPGRCIAGLRLDGTGWLRPVSDVGEGQLLPEHTRLPDGSQPQLLDVIRIGLAQHRPLPHQPENYLIDGSRWELLHRPAPDTAVRLLAEQLHGATDLFGDRSSAIAETRFQQTPAKESLVLVRPAKVAWRTDFNDFTQKRRARVLFRLGPSCDYDLPLTDPAFVSRVKALPIGDHGDADVGIPESAMCLFTISLGEPLKGWCYKLVAAVVILPPAWAGHL